MLNSLAQMLRLPSYVFVLTLVVTVVALLASSDRDMALPMAEAQFERLVSQELAGAEVDIRGLSFRLNSAERKLFVKANQLWVEGLGDAPDTILSDIGADFNLTDVLYGDLDPLNLTWGGLKFGIVADPNGVLSFGLNPTPGGTQGASSMPFFLSEAHASAPDVGSRAQDSAAKEPFTADFFKDYLQLTWIDDVFGALPNLDEITLDDVDLSYQDMRTGFGVETRAANMTLSRAGDGQGRLTLVGDIAVGSRLESAPTTSLDDQDWTWEVVDLDLVARLNADNWVSALQFSANDLVPASLLPLLPDNQLMAMIDRPVDLKAGFRFDGAGALTRMSGSVVNAISREVSFSIRPKAGDIWRVETLTAGVNPNAEPLLLEMFEFLAPIDAPFSGAATMLYDGFGALQVYQMDLFQDAPGLVSLPDVWTQRQPFRNMAVSVQGDLTTSDITTSGLEFRAPNSDKWVTASLDANVQTTPRGTRIAMDMSSDVRIDQSLVRLLWPDANPNDQARGWFKENVKAGQVFAADMSMQMSSNGAGQPLVVDDFRTNFRFANAQVHVTQGLGVSSIESGSVQVANQDVVVTGTAGSLGPLAGQQLRMSIDFDHEWGGLLDLSVALQGDAVAGARYLSNANLGLEALATSLPLNQAQGQVAGQMKAVIPLTDQDQIFDQFFEYEFSGNLNDYRLRSYLGGQDIIGSQARVFSTNSSTQLAGNITLGSTQLGFGSRAAFDLRFNHQARDLSVRGTFESSVASAQPFIGPLAQYGEGGVSGQYSYRASTTAQGRGRVDVVADLTAVEIDLPFIFYKKPMGRQTSVSAGIELMGGKPLSIPRFNLGTPQSQASGKVAFAAGRTDKLEVQFDTLAFDGTRLDRVVLGVDGKQINVAAKGGVINAQSAVESLFGNGNASNQNARDNVRNNGRVGFGLDPEMVIVVRFDDIARLILPNGRFFNSVTSSLSLQNNGVEHMRFRGQPPAIHQGRPNDVGVLTASIEPIAGGYTFNLRTDDAGSAFYASNLNDSVRLGELQVKAYSPVAFPHGGWKGSLNAENIFLFNAPIFGRLFQVASLTGIGELLSGTGLGFSQVRADFTYSPGNIFVDNWQMLGPSIGMTGQGGINFRDKTINVRGTVTPLGALNEITQQLPLIGTLLNGLDGGGLFSATYSIRGPFSDPGMFVNPWTSLTPGAFRDLYRAATGSF